MAWQTRSAGQGAKGPRLYEWALVDLDTSEQPGHRWLLIRRHPRTGELAFYRCYNPEPVPLTILVTVASSRWTIEESLCATRRSAVSPVKPGRIGGRFLGLMAYPMPKG